MMQSKNKGKNKSVGEGDQGGGVMGSLWGSMLLKMSPLFCLIPSGCNSTAFRERGKERALKRKSSVMRMGRGGGCYDYY